MHMQRGIYFLLSEVKHQSPSFKKSLLLCLESAAATREHYITKQQHLSD